MASRRQTSIEPAFIDNTTIEDLKATELFQDVNEEVLKHTLKSDNSRICGLPQNRRLYTNRHDVDYLYIIRKGFVSIWIPSCFDRDKLVFLAWRGPQQILGELRKVGDTPSKTVIKTSEACEFIEIRLDFFLDLAASNCFLYRNMVNMILRKVSNEGHRSEVVQMAIMMKRVAQSLIHLAEDRCENFVRTNVGPVEIPGIIRQSELAAYAGTSRRFINKALGRLRAATIISYNGDTGSRITLNDVPELENIVRSTSHPLLLEEE